MALDSQCGSRLPLKSVCMVFKLSRYFWKTVERVFCDAKCNPHQKTFRHIYTLYRMNGQINARLKKEMHGDINVA